jgi:DNA-binding NarL/FixJ family response regulator
MPGMHGFEVKQQLRARGLRIPTVFVTADADDEVTQHLEATGAIAIVPKPVDQQKLLRLTRGVVGERRGCFSNVRVKGTCGRDQADPYAGGEVMTLLTPEDLPDLQSVTSRTERGGDRHAPRSMRPRTEPWPR